MKNLRGMWILSVALAGAWAGACSSDPESADGGFGGGGAGGEGGAGAGGGNSGGSVEPTGGFGGDIAGEGGLGGEGGEGPVVSGHGTGGETSSGGSPQTCTGTVAIHCNSQATQPACEAVGCTWQAVSENCAGMASGQANCADIATSVCADVAGCTLN